MIKLIGWLGWKVAKLFTTHHSLLTLSLIITTQKENPKDEAISVVRIKTGNEIVRNYDLDLRETIVKSEIENPKSEIEDSPVAQFG